MIVRRAIKNDAVVAGGGAIEMELSKYLRDFSRSIAGKEQLLIGSMARALEIIPRQLCDNAGFDATNILNKLRQKHFQGKRIDTSSGFFVGRIKRRIARYVFWTLNRRIVFYPMDSYIFGQLDAVRYIEPVNKGFPRPRRGTVYQNSVQTGHWTLYKVRKARTNHIFVNLPWLLNTGRGLVRWLNFCTITMDEISHLRNFRTFDVDAQSCTPTIPLRPCNLTQNITWGIWKR